MFFDINPSAAVPIYRQIIDQVRRMIASGQFKPGDELPSVRNVAAKHSVNPMTVSKAYGLLEAEGLVSRLRGQGMVIAERQPMSNVQDRLELLRPSLQSAALHARQLQIPVKDALALFKNELEGGKE
jgi:GntR family transcriptional regulator